jgi:hypothetical protein
MPCAQGQSSQSNREYQVPSTKYQVPREWGVGGGDGEEEEEAEEEEEEEEEEAEEEEEEDPLGA